MTNSMNSTLRRGLLAALALLVFLPTAHAQNGKRLAEALDLTDAQALLVAKALDGTEHGNLWQLSADLAPTLTAEQQEKLFARPEHAERGDRMHRQRGEGGRHGEARDKQPRPERSDADADARRAAMDARHTERKAAMQQALDLTDTQVQQLEALHAEHKAEREQRRSDRGERRAERPEPGELPADLAAILTPEQQEIAKVQRALAAWLMHGRRHRDAQR